MNPVAIEAKQMVLSEGVMVERGPTLDVIGEAKDPYTCKLLAAIPKPGVVAQVRR